jgi:DNA primase
MLFPEYLKDRTRNTVWKDVVVHEATELVTFLLYSPDGRLVGYQVHDWKAPRLQTNEGYYSYYISKHELPIFGLEYVDFSKPLFLVEGCFDVLAVRHLGYQAISLLSVNIKKAAVTWLLSLTNTISICDGDKAGKKLADYSYGGKAIYLPDGEDPSSMPPEQLDDLIKRFMYDKKQRVKELRNKNAMDSN